MCGICAIVNFSCDSQGQDDSGYSLISEESIARLKNRGPTCSDSKTVRFNDNISLSFFASVLHLRGTSPIPQPYHENGNYFLWNGEVFEGIPASCEEESDTRNLYCLLENTSDVLNILHVLSGIHGPWAFIYWQKEKGLLWFGRDTFGRRSLLWSGSSYPSFSFGLSSVELKGYKWDDVPANGVYCLDILKSQENNGLEIKLYRWSKSVSGKQLKSSPNAFQINGLTCHITIEDVEILSPIKESLNLNRVTETCCERNRSSSDIPELKDIVLEDFLPETIFKSLLRTCAMETAVSEFEYVLSKALEKRVNNQPFICKNCFKCNLSIGQENKCLHSSVGILFSGGVDSMVIAALAQRYIPLDVPIDLINVAFSHQKSFEKKRIKKNDANCPLNLRYDTPDRIIGRQGVQELQNLFSLRTWNFVQVNVTQNQLEWMRSQYICHLIKPANTVLDDSIGCACWFAAKGEGIVDTTDGPKKYCSPSRVLLLGMGADEQLAGYSRHRCKYNSNGWDGVLEELALELDRISSRNLGRDDRIISDHGREARFPFLDENVVSFLNKLPVNVKADFEYPRGIGEKLLLRLLAYKLGLKKAASIPKRAIQFGSRIARIENYREKGSDICSRLCTDS